MLQQTKKILAVGASGQFAGLVVPQLIRRGAVVRALLHDRAKDAQARSLGAAETVVGDLADRARMDAALEDIDAVFYIAPAFLPHEAEVGVGLVKAARAAGVRRFVFSSVIHPILSALVNHAQKAPVEEALLTSGMEYVLLHPTVFFQNFTQAWPRIVQSGVLAEPWSADSRFSRVDYRDVAEAAAIALTEDRLLYGTFECCAEGWHDRHEVVAIISQVLGRQIQAERIGPKLAAASAGPAAAGLQRMFEWYDERGLKGNALTLRAILGREPRTLRQFFEELAAPDAAA